MKRSTLGLVMATIALSLSVVCSAAGTPEGTLKEFLTAAQKKDRKAVKSAIDWEGLGKSMGADQEKDPAKRKMLMDQIQIVFLEVYANMGKQANVYQVGKVTTKGTEAKGTFMRMDPNTKKMVPSTEFSLHKKGKDWLIYNIATPSNNPNKTAKAH